MTRQPIIVSTVLCLVLIPLLNAQSTALDEGVSLIREGRFDLALIKLEQAHRVAPRNAAVENLLGITETKLDHIEEADKHYRNAILLDPSQAPPHRNLGFNLLAAKDYSRAGLELREAARFDPTNEFAHFYLLLLALATGHDAGALEQVSHSGKLVDNDPEAAAIWSKRRSAWAASMRRPIASSIWSVQINCPPHASIGSQFFSSQHALYDQAVHCFRQIASLDASWGNRYNLALALLYE